MIPVFVAVYDIMHHVHMHAAIHKPVGVHYWLLECVIYLSQMVFFRLAVVILFIRRKLPWLPTPCSCGWYCPLIIRIPSWCAVVLSSLLPLLWHYTCALIGPPTTDVMRGKLILHKHDMWLPMHNNNLHCRLADPSL